MAQVKSGKLTQTFLSMVISQTKQAPNANFNDMVLACMGGGPL